jgi:hypothetical protein
MAGFPVALGPVGYPLPAYADGGYPILYLDSKDRVLCAACCNDPECEYGPAVLADVNWEGAPLDCDGCGEEIESAYGDLEASDVDPNEPGSWPDIDLAGFEP